MRGFILHLAYLSSFFFFDRSVPRAHGGDKSEVTTATAQAVIEAWERKWERVRWRIHYRRGPLTDVKHLESIKVGPEYDKGLVIFEPMSGRYRLELESVQKWYAGADPYGAERAIWTFDGEIARDFHRFKGGLIPPEPKDHPGDAEVKKGSTDQVLRRWAACGAGFFPPYCSSSRKISDLIKERLDQKQPVTVTLGPGGLLLIRTTQPDIPKGIVTFTFHPKKGWIKAEMANGEPPQTWCRIDVEHQRVQDGLWVPKAVSRLYVFGKMLDRIEFSDVKINQPVDDSVFRQEFPRGARVTDHIQKKKYVVGAPVKDEEEEAALLFVQAQEPVKANQPVKEGAAPLLFDPPAFDFGIFPAEGNSVPLRKHVTVKNGGKRAVVVARVESTCGCISLIDWKGGALEPGESRKVSFSVLPGSWGIAGVNTTRYITFVFSDASEQSLKLVGETAPSQPDDKLVIQPADLRLEVSPSRSHKVVVKREITVTRQQTGLKSLQAQSKVPWIRATVGAIKESSAAPNAFGKESTATIQLEIHADNKLLESNSAVGEVIVSTKEKSSRAPLKVTVFRRDFVRVNSDLVVLTKEKETESVRLVPVSGRAKTVRVLKTWAEPNALKVAVDASDGPEAAVRVIRLQSTKAGYYAIRCLVESDADQEAVVTFAAFVQD